ncbi:Fanconi anemia group M protein [Leguminivora glycinivorella]|uniref:Fanconi anemia group M protein n=1 Tax=Leguminivora glycinivorella TaxID=1035111 RepID=UPI00200BB510|nr:Fanconi anemia group M protein [Leguminivora glycinivorella]
MNSFKEKSSKNDGPGEDDDLFDDSSIMAHFENNSFKDRSNFSKSVINDSLNNSNNPLNISALCCDEEISGYDRLTGKTWIYPTNYPVRDYQFNIIRAALLKNTLVSLPTGLGKTFIAAVIMYNFYRWYPLGKIVFTAPTRPLVAQQIDACYNIIAIPPNDTIEMTGHMPVNTRKLHWQTKRVFFATPQVIYNDIKSGICPGDNIRCLVVDEAHRARGNYAYCQIVATLAEMKHRTYRMLALSATPGSKVDDVINVVKHLNIAHLELRTENCLDVAPYSHSRKINTVVVQLGPQLTQLRNHYVEILDGYARRLKQMNILPHNVGNLSKGRIVMLYKEYQGKERGSRHPQHNYIMKDFTLLIALYHGLELLVKHGARVFLNFFDDHPEKSWLQADDRLTALLERLRDDLGVNPMSLDTSVLPDGSFPDIPKDLHFGHPKFDRLKEIMLEHFQAAKRNGQDTKAIVFCEYRESVNLVHCLLLQCRPLIVPQMFVGQGASGKDNKPVVSQKQQLRVMRQFREGACNALVATCVCEEGLDVGSVDLILCFDISTASPVRLVQRCGRTGRERGGKVFILVTEGREHQTLMDCMRRRDGLNAKILQSKEVATNLYKANPRMMPHDLTPVCQKMFITVQKTDTKDTAKAQTDKNKKNQKDLRNMLTAGSSTSTSTSTVEGGGFITESEFQDIFPDGYQETDHLPQHKEYWAMDKETFKQATHGEGKLNLSTWLEWQRNPQNTVKVEHSTDTQVLTSLLQYSDAKRFELPPSTQNPTFSTQNLATQNFSVPTPEKPKLPKKTKKAPVVKSPVKRCGGDIRALFSTATKSTKNYTKLINDLGIQNDGSIPTSLINLLVDLRLDNESVRSCLICQNICDCALIENIRKHRKKFPNVDLIDDLDAESLVVREKTINNSQDLFEDYKDSTYMEANKNNCSNFDLEFDFGSPEEAVTADKAVESIENTDKRFDLGDIEEIFADSSPEEAIIKEAETKNDSDPKQALGFFGLDSIEDIFGESDESRLEPSHAKENKTEINENNNHVIDQVDKFKVQVTESEIVCPVSPSILSGQVKTSKKPETSPTSPILCTQARKFKLSTKRNQPKSSTPLGNAKRQLIPPATSSSSKLNQPNNTNMISNQSGLNMNSKSVIDTTNKSMFTITQLVEMINNKTDRSITQTNISKALEEPKVMENDDRSTSPILLTQAVRKRTVQSLNNSIKSNNCVILDKKAESLIVLDSDSSSDSNEATQMYDIEDLKNDTDFNQSKVKEPYISPISNKRKLSEEDVTLNASPYFNKRQKLENHEKPLTLQEKVLAALNRSQKPDNHDNSINFMFSQKENENPQENIISPKDDDDKEKYVNRMNLEMLQAFRRDSQVKNPKRLFEDSPIRKVALQRRRLLSDSDDDFVTDDKRSQRPKTSRDSHKSTTNHKVRKKKAGNSFLEIEAEESDDASGSDDEHSDDSVGSIAEFLCDEPVSHADMQAHYMRSVTGTVNGAFKIPELPTRFKREEIFSQFVEEEDSYEMDSFCVDSHIGLTQVNDVSELELAEIILEERKTKKKSKPPKQQIDTTTSGDSPLVIRKKKSKRQIQSDSDDSS